MDNLMTFGLLIAVAGVLMGVNFFYVFSLREAERKYRDRFFGCFLGAVTMLGAQIYFGTYYPEMLSDGLVGLLAGTILGIRARWWLRGSLDGATVVYANFLAKSYTLLLSPPAVVITVQAAMFLRNWRVQFSVLTALALGCLIHWLYVRSLERTLGREIYEVGPMPAKVGIDLGEDFESFLRPVFSMTSSWIEARLSSRPRKNRSS